ncbi:hypothetical protein CHS0354_025083 [Potamilus streckersoni]|uniref:Uncharacterized protein n=1 Tax=Potamilus streckersoni TaxID=2493646 RepID=A0AAE0TA70_9BIVA|nr:hypothetical protein CHS0354_025083 [Potamilus streckersoni]
METGGRPSNGGNAYTQCIRLPMLCTGGLGAFLPTEAKRARNAHVLLRWKQGEGYDVYFPTEAPRTRSAHVGLCWKRKGGGSLGVFFPTVATRADRALVRRCWKRGQALGFFLLTEGTYARSAHVFLHWKRDELLSSHACTQCTRLITLETRMDGWRFFLPTEAKRARTAHVCLRWKLGEDLGFFPNGGNAFTQGTRLPKLETGGGRRVWVFSSQRRQRLHAVHKFADAENGKGMVSGVFHRTEVTLNLETGEREDLEIFLSKEATCASSAHDCLRWRRVSGLSSQWRQHVQSVNSFVYVGNGKGRVWGYPNNGGNAWTQCVRLPML